ncbi:unnamed protein product [Adineta ricciae]|uniref:Uncharacterized protein n=1 Tax=Adineta ricciae TaxID=249248 RepID=A0A816BR13_ADIRI|nr:unnamed protein product [Adineta ricciae]CAF1613372.1 unnamed protein product [Adineta ricciae]
MAITAASIWDWSLPVLPFTSIITLIVALFADRLLDSQGMMDRPFFEIPVARRSSTHVCFLVGIFLLLPQIIAIIIGRFQFLVKTQSMINRIILSIFHVSTLIPLVFFLLVAIVKRSRHSDGYQMGVYGIFTSISLYCFLHTILICYLYIRRSNAPQHGKVIWPIWFLSCCILLIIFYSIWIHSHSGIAGFIVVFCPFIYFLGFVHQFWLQARARQRYSAVTRVIALTDI